MAARALRTYSILEPSLPVWHFTDFFIAPILHVIWDRFGVANEMVMFGDWRPWLGGMAALNALAFWLIVSLTIRCLAESASSRIKWEDKSQEVLSTFAFALALSMAGVATYLWQLGGISGVVEAYEKNQEAFVGKGWLLVFRMADSCPLIHCRGFYVD